MSYVSLLAVLLPALVLSPSLPHQDWEEQVSDQIAAIHAEIASDYEYASDMLIGEISEGEIFAFDVDIDGAAEYVIVGVCDFDCGDLDMAIYDPEQDEAAADIEVDDYPVLHVTGEGLFELEVGMASCDADTCLFAVQVFVRY